MGALLRLVELAGGWAPHGHGSSQAVTLSTSELKADLVCGSKDPGDSRDLVLGQDDNSSVVSLAILGPSRQSMSIVPVVQKRLLVFVRTWIAKPFPECKDVCYWRPNPDRWPGRATCIGLSSLPGM